MNDVSTNYKIQRETFIEESIENDSLILVKNEENKKLYVNFDLEIMQLIREAKCMDRVGIEIPESARIILL